ncbi:uncharacterized protein LOC142240182 [Haematobia irritans]|uniref:uncharacterized protein LOC142240182 n=1 Tax=Haematobia irritans TaxID=7368 RepID=UPI003F4F3F94
MQKMEKYRKAKLENAMSSWNMYKRTRNMYKAKIINTRNRYINSKINGAKNQKQMWRKIKDLVLRNEKSAIDNVIFNQIEYKDNRVIANKFNEYFVNSIRMIRDEIDDVQYQNRIHMTSTKFQFRTINMNELLTICKQLKNKPDFNHVSTTIIFDNWDKIGKMILKTINDSLERGIFPEKWKETMVIPIEKVQRTKKYEEFRPINTLMTCEKILEKVVKEQLEKYIEKNGILSKYQPGFRKNYSCETSVNYVINRWKNKNKKDKTLAMFIDFKRAFETIDTQ